MKLSSFVISPHLLFIFCYYPSKIFFRALSWWPRPTVKMWIIKKTTWKLCILSLVSVVLGMLGKLLTVLTEILSKPTFPVEWSSLSVSLIKTILITVKQTSQCIVQQINFDKLLWMSFFRLSSSFILSPLLNIDDSKNGRVSILSELPSNIRLSVGDGLNLCF